MSSDEGGELSRLFGGLSDRDRRLVCYYLREHGSASVGTLADLVTGWVEAGPGPNESVDHGDVRVGLHHVHLPALDAAGLVAYDADAGTVTFEGVSAAGERVLDAALAADTTDSGVDLEGLLAAAGDAGAEDGS
ncbi:DUF7344 domain-containing protein [Halosimplex marinum]|uniref:DUF7344 domain-containing protein n=1 Tax=Halosimplex marinum TaxID=3396620 RepID=UPI003F57A751